MKYKLFYIIGIIASIFISLLGGWDKGLATLIGFMAVDYLTGLIVALVFKKSEKTETGAASSNIGFKGLLKKAMVLMIVMMAYRLDLMNDTEYIRNSVIIGYICIEAISIIENLGLMGVPLPDIMMKGIDLLNKKAGDQNVSQ